MDRRTFLSSLAGAGLAPAAPKQPPNIVILFGADLGYCDIGCLRCSLHTSSVPYFAVTGGPGNYVAPDSLFRGNQRIERDSSDFYLTDAIGANAVRHIEQARSPFLLYTAFTSPHWPLHALEPDIARYR